MNFLGLKSNKKTWKNNRMTTPPCRVEVKVLVGMIPTHTTMLFIHGTTGFHLVLTFKCYNYFSLVNLKKSGRLEFDGWDRFSIGYM